MRIGVDVGGTNTDAVLMDGSRVLASHKAETTANVSDGIVAAISDVLQQAGVAPASLSGVMVGTTHFTNAFVERRHLLEVGVLRLGLPASRGLPPMIDWPQDLAAAVGRHHYLLEGGYQFDGREISPLDEAGVLAAARELKRKGIRSAAISCIFSPVKDDMEERAAALLRSEVPDLAISLSSRIGRIGLLERENAAIMNASLAQLAQDVVGSFRSALDQLAITAPFYISQNDGTLMTAEFVAQYPVLTFASGPTNSMRGAAYLSGLEDAIVVDIGGTTADVGVLSGSFPRESTVSVDIGGVRTNFRMPDILAVGLGGGSEVSEDGARVGPRSVGYQLRSRARVFGGDVLTATDIAVAAGYAAIGDASRVAALPPAVVERAVARIHALITEAVDRMKTSAAAMPLILVGGGAVLVNRAIPGASEVVVPEHAGVANAIGASIAQVGGEIDKVYAYDNVSREQALEEAKAEACANAVAAGAAATTVRVVDLEELPLNYMPGNAVRVRVKAAGDLEQ
ncbi:MAG TPA: hydantoinase subunit beta [Halieaceae bacterium]|nr:hydantoinase subunit beta [Halieaceae bacterium]